VDGPDVIADSTAIALHLERRHPLPALLPADPQLRARVLLLEDWADTALASGCRLALLQAAAGDPVLRTALLPESTPAPLRQLVGGLPAALLGGLGDTLGGMLAGDAAGQLQRNLEQLAVLCAANPYLVGDALSLADLAVAAQLSLLCFPASSGAPLAGRGVTGIADNPLLASLFRWRDQLLVQRAPA
jgi:glutathione S-transferase